MTFFSFKFSIEPMVRFFLRGAALWSLFLFSSVNGEEVAVSANSQDSAKQAFIENIERAQDDKELLMDAYYDFGEYLDEEEAAYEASIIQFESALKIAQDVNNHERVSSFANYLACLYCVLGDFSKAIEAYEMALESSEHLQDFHNMAKVSMNIAGTYSFMGNYKEAVSHALYAINIKETKNDLIRICYHYITLGNIFRENNNVSKWEEYVKKAYSLKDVDGCASFDDIAKIYNGLGGLSSWEEDYEKALNYYDTLLVLSKEVEYDQGICLALTNSAQIYFDLGQFDKALDLTHQAEAYFGGDTYDIVFNNNWKAELYKELGQNEAALALVRENIQRDDIQYYYTERIKSLGLLYELNFRLKNYQEAYRWNDSLRTAESQMHAEDARRVVEELETQYETAKKEKQIELLTVENELKTQRLRTGMVVIFILIVLIILAVYIYQMKRKQAQFIENDLQQKVLRAQMNPHFIFNVLSSIQYFMLANDAKKASGI
ncbi:kinesin light chain-like protein [Geofilum rubicundum JCM 15548]|uniref:Kinesin light chain-like protein n=1 Tax=Geofilum rubicundum JCM 15548 TaxID=1236989 RepID=A0A0E9LRB4_9BACT|nr:kinesin light chain-like protein [Geofilum rubicundum JCM 15548]